MNIDTEKTKVHILIDNLCGTKANFVFVFTQRKPRFISSTFVAENSHDRANEIITTNAFRKRQINILFSDDSHVSTFDELCDHTKGECY